MPVSKEGRGGTSRIVDDGTAVRVMDDLRRVVRVLGTSARGASRRGGVSGAQLFVMRQISLAPGLSIGELVTRTLSRQSTVSEVVARLVERGLVARGASAVDARQTELTLTPRGRRIMATAKPTAQEQLANGLRALPAERREALAQSLELWLSAAGLAEIPATMFFEEGERPPVRRGAGGKRPSGQ